MEPNRSHRDPVVEIIGNLITPGVRYSAEAYKLANRRWYCLDATLPDVPDGDWLSATVVRYTSEPTTPLTEKQHHIHPLRRRP